jgi:hypothetical protein
LTGPVKHFIWAIIIEIAYMEFLHTTTLDNHDVFGRFLRGLVHGFSVSAILLLAQTIGLRFFAL